MMEVRINCCIRDIFMLDGRTIPPTLGKHLTNNIFIKPNKEAMEQVLYHLLPLTDPNCLKTIPWPISTFKEAAEFRTAATRIINNLNGFVYEKSSNVISKVNSSLLANPGGRIFIFFMYQLCSYIMCCELKKKGIDILNRPLYIVDEYIDKKISMFNAISESNFNEVNEIISQIDYNLENITESTIKWKEIIQDSKQHIKDLKSELLNIKHCEVTENEVVELKQKYMNLYENFEQKKIVAMKCNRLADIILKTQENWDANKINLIYNINKNELIEDGKIDLVKLLTTIKNTLNDSINYCEQLNNEEVINNKMLKTEQLIIDMSKQMQSYKEIIQINYNLIDELKLKNEKLEKEVFTSKHIENIDPRLQLVYQKIPPIILKTDFTDELKSISSGDNKKTRRSILLQCSTPYEYQNISFDKIKEVYMATLLNQNEVTVQNVLNETINEHSSKLNESNQNIQITSLKNNYNGTLLEDTFQTPKNQLLSTTHLTELDETENLNKSLQIQIKEDEVKSVSISRKSIENIKKKFNQIKKQAMSTIPHSPLSPQSF